MIINIPIEPIESRYSMDWYKWFERELTDRQFKYKTIIPKPLTDKIRDGAFLDVVGTTHFKATQIASVAWNVDQGIIPRNERVVFLIHDGWFPIEQLAYMRDMLGCHAWKFVGLFHAGTYDRWDQTAQHGMYTWGEDIENGWFKIYDKIIVASDYHMNLILQNREVHQSKFAVIPWKVEVPQINIKKENWIVFPHRHDLEKQPYLFNVNNFKEPIGYWAIDPNAICESLEDAKIKGTVKSRYYETLAKSKICVSFSLQETFGIAMVESVLLGCIPLVPDRLSYKEMYPRCFRYQGESEFKEKLTKFCNGDVPVNQLQFLQDKFRRNAAEFFNSLEDVINNV